MRKPCPCCGGVPGGFGGTLVVNSQPADLQAENARLRELLAEERAVVAGVTLSLAWAYERMDDMGGLTRPLHPSASNTKAAQERADEYRAAHRNAAQQEGQGDGE